MYCFTRLNFRRKWFSDSTDFVIQIQWTIISHKLHVNTRIGRSQRTFYPSRMPFAYLILLLVFVLVSSGDWVSERPSYVTLYVDVDEQIFLSKCPSFQNSKRTCYSHLFLSQNPATRFQISGLRMRPWSIPHNIVRTGSRLSLICH
jgi:hypothetical protein